MCVPFQADPESRPLPPATVVAVELRQTIVSGRLSDLHRPDFHEFQPSVSSVYEQSAYSPLWIEGATFTPKGEAILDALLMSGSKGLDPQDFDGVVLRERATRTRNSGGSAHEVAVLDLALTIDLMRYASALHQGRVDPRQVHFAIRQKDRLDSAAFVREYRNSSQNLSSMLTQIEPPFRGYRNTLAALARYQDLALREGEQMPVRPRFPLRRGQKYPDNSKLAARLVLLGDLASTAEVQSGIYDGALVDAVKKLQLRHGLASTGILDAQTWRALSTPLFKRVEQLELTLERWRWLPSTVTPAIVVNIPEFELRAYDENRQMALRMHVIVGKAYRRRTPVFEDKLETVIVRPWWSAAEHSAQ